MLKKITPFLISSLLFFNANIKPVKSNPVTLPAISACSTGVGCIIVGSVLIGGTIFYLYQHKKDGRRFIGKTKTKVILHDSIRTISGRGDYVIVKATSAKKARQECEKNNPPGTIVKLTPLGNGKYQCDFVDVSKDVDIDWLLKTLK